MQSNSVKAGGNGNSIWRAVVKYGIEPEETILQHKEELLEIIKAKGFRLKDIEIIAK